MIDPAAWDAIRAHLASVSGIPKIIWPNEAAEVSPPFLTFDFGPELTTPITVDGQETVDIRPVIGVNVNLGEFTTEQDALLWSIAQAFKFDTRIPFNGNDYVQSLRTPEADNGLPGEAYFRRSLTLRLRVIQIL